MIRRIVSIFVSWCGTGSTEGIVEEGYRFTERMASEMQFELEVSVWCKF